MERDSRRYIQANIDNLKRRIADEQNALEMYEKHASSCRTAIDNMAQDIADLERAIRFLGRMRDSSECS